MSDALLAETITITGDNGDKIEAYSARALDEAPRGGVVVIHHMPGYDAADQGDRPQLRVPRLQRGRAQPVLARGPGREPG